MAEHSPSAKPVNLHSVSIINLLFFTLCIFAGPNFPPIHGQLNFPQEDISEIQESDGPI